MLLEFRIANYRAFRDEAALSLVASSDKTLEETNTFETPSNAGKRAVRTVAIYGQNAGGKTTLLRALDLMSKIIQESVRLKPGAKWNVQPFMLDDESRDKPTLFEATILLNGVRHQYGFEIDKERVHAEWLLVYEHARPQTWFDRRYNEETGETEYTYSSFLPGSKKVWEEATRSNTLFLSTATQLNSEALSPLFNWFSDELHVFLDGGHIAPNFSNSWAEGPERRDEIRDLLRAADISISDIVVERKKAKLNEMKIDLATGDASLKRDQEGEIFVTQFRHNAGTAEALFDYNDESQGTQKLYALAGPIIDIIERGRVLVIDEIDRSLHPLLVRRMIEIFQDPVVNTTGAQLIFTTHDTSLLDPTLLRRDQIWFSERDQMQAAHLVPLTDFSPRKGEAFEKGYLSGRYGGVPILANRLIPADADA